MADFLNKRDFWGNRLSLWIVVLMVFFLPMCGWLVQQIRFDNQTEYWLPDSDHQLQTLRWVREQFPVDEQVLLTWDGSSINDPRIGKLVELLTGQLDDQGVKRGGLPHVSTVVDPQTILSIMEKNGVEPREAIRRLEGMLVGVGPLRLRLTEAGRSSLKKTIWEIRSTALSQLGVELAVTEATAELSSLVSIPSASADNTSDNSISPLILAADGKPIENFKVEHDLQVTWKGMQIGSAETVQLVDWLCRFAPKRTDGAPLVETAFFAAGSPIAVTIGLSDTGLADTSEALTAIRTACDRAGIPGDSLHMTGRAVSAQEMNNQMANAVWNTSVPWIQIHRRSPVLTAALIAALAVFVVVRNIRLAASIVLISLFTMFGGLALIISLGGSPNLLTILMPVLLMAVTVSGAIVLASSWYQSASNSGPSNTGEIVQTSMPSILVGLAAAVGFMSLGSSPLQPVRELGYFAAIGTVFSLLMNQLGLVSLMQLLVGKPPKMTDLSRSGWTAIARFLSNRTGIQSLIVVTVCIACGFGISRLQTQSMLLRSFSESARITQDHWRVENNTSGTLPFEMVVRFDRQSQKDSNFIERMEIVRQIGEQLRSLPGLSGSISLADFQPTNELASQDSGFLQKAKFNKRSSAIQQQIRDTNPSIVQGFYTVSEKGSDLTAPGDGRLNKPGDELWRISGRARGMAETNFSLVLADMNRAAQDILKIHPGSQHVIAGGLPIAERTYIAVRDSLVGSFGLGCLLIFGLFVAAFRSLSAGILVLFSSIAPIAAVFGVACWLGQPIDIGSMATASIGLGISAGGTACLLAALRRTMQPGRSHKDAMIDALTVGGPVMVQYCVVIGCGWVALAYCDFEPISRFGMMLASICAAATLAQLFLLPQLLAGPIGGLVQSTSKPVIVPIEAVPTALTPTTTGEITRETTVPEPHIKPHDPAKKRRSSRRDRDAG